MTKIPVVWLSLHDHVLPRGQWDDQILEDLFAGEFGDLGCELKHYEFDKVPALGTNGGILIVHARHHADEFSVEEVGAQVTRLGKENGCILILVGDEASVFPLDKLDTGTTPTKVWVMDPRPDRHQEADRYLINGYAPAIKKFTDTPEKDLDWFFAGQSGHPKREQMIGAIQGLENGELIVTEGFTEGLPSDEYYSKLARAKIALCPAGPHTPDTFRLWEALELGCIPIVDRKPSRQGYPDGFWEFMLGEVPPFVFVDDWNDIKKLIPQVLKDWRSKSIECSAWWKRHKRKMVKELKADIYTLSK